MARTQRKWKTMKPGAYVSHDSRVTRDTEEHKSSRQGRRQIVLPIESENSHGVLQSLLWVLGAML